MWWPAVNSAAPVPSRSKGLCLSRRVMRSWASAGKASSPSGQMISSAEHRNTSQSADQCVTFAGPLHHFSSTVIYMSVFCWNISNVSGWTYTQTYTILQLEEAVIYSWVMSMLVRNVHLRKTPTIILQSRCILFSWWEHSPLTTWPKSSSGVSPKNGTQPTKNS